MVLLSLVSLFVVAQPLLFRAPHAVEAPAMMQPAEELLKKVQSNAIPSETFRLWEGDAPGAQGQAPEDIPTLTPHLPSTPNGSAFIVCPGGGYQGLADHEAGPPAEWLNTLGITAFVLKYRLGPKYHHPVELGDAQRAIRYVRSHAAEWGLNPNRIGILGFSAGGHLTGTAATLFDGGKADAPDPIERVSSRPDAAVLIYPVITMTDPFTHAGSRLNLLGEHPTKALIDHLSVEKQVTAQTPPSFLVTTNEDTVVPMENSTMYVAACRKFKVPVELYVFGHGSHGFGMGGGDPVLNQWPKFCGLWLKRLGIAS